MKVSFWTRCLLSIRKKHLGNRYAFDHIKSNAFWYQIMMKRFDGWIKNFRLIVLIFEFYMASNLRKIPFLLMRYQWDSYQVWKFWKVNEKYNYSNVIPDDAFEKLENLKLLNFGFSKISFIGSNSFRIRDKINLAWSLSTFSWAVCT